MKKIKTLMLLAAAAVPYFCGCSAIQTLPPDLDRAFRKSLEIEYVKEPVIKLNRGVKISEDYWQTPKETEKRGGGDCEDLAKKLIEDYKKDGIKAEFAVGYLSEDLPYGHAWAEVYRNGNRYVLDPACKWWEKNPKEGSYIRRDLYPWEKIKLQQLEERIENGE